MLWFSWGVAGLAALAIIGIGVGYLARPQVMAPSFGLPPPEGGPGVFWWLRLKGTRDVASGLIVLAIMAMGAYRELGWVLLIAALIPLGDMATVLAAKGRTATALGVHGVTAAVMILGAVPLMAAGA
jgi:hypothetical protein